MLDISRPADSGLQRGNIPDLALQRANISEKGLQRGFGGPVKTFDPY